MAHPRSRADRTADPYRETDVIDSRAPRFAQAVTGAVALLGVVFGWPLAWALMALQILMGLTLGRQFCLPCLAYFELVQPRLANMIGVAVLSAAATAWWLGAETLGTVLGGLVAALASLAATTGLCVGCEIYRLVARLRGVSPRNHDRIDPSDLPALDGAAQAFVEFTHPLCSECGVWERRLRERGEPLVTVDVSERPEMARKYGITVVPTVFAIAGDGTLLRRLAP